MAPSVSPRAISSVPSFIRVTTSLDAGAVFVAVAVEVPTGLVDTEDVALAFEGVARADCSQGFQVTRTAVPAVTTTISPSTLIGLRDDLPSCFRKSFEGSFIAPRFYRVSQGDVQLTTRRKACFGC